MALQPQVGSSPRNKARESPAEMQAGLQATAREQQLLLLGRRGCRYGGCRRLGVRQLGSGSCDRSVRRGLEGRPEKQVADENDKRERNDQRQEQRSSRVVTDRVGSPARTEVIGISLIGHGGSPGLRFSRTRTPPRRA